MRRTKLVPPPRRRWRVRDAARELGRTVTEALAGLAEIGEYASGPLDLLEEPVFAKLATHFGVTLPSASEHAEVRDAGESPEAGGQRLGLTTPPPLPRRDNHPYRDPEPRPRDLLVNTRIRRQAEPTERDYRSGRWQSAGAAFEEHEWALRGFTDAEKDVWLDAGLKDNQAKLAERLRDVGLTPQDLSADLDGWTVLDRVAQGEDVGAVADFYARRGGGREAG